MDIKQADAIGSISLPGLFRTLRMPVTVTTLLVHASLSAIRLGSGI